MPKSISDFEKRDLIVLNARPRRRFRFLRSILPLLAIAVLTACSTTRKNSEESFSAPDKWYAHCDVCKWCKGSFKRRQQAEAIVSEHNKRLHDWYKVAYYDLTKCP